MTDKPWEKKITAFIKHTGEEFKRAGEQFRTEAQKLIEEVKDPQYQQKLKESFNTFGAWAKRRAEEAGQMLEGTVKKAEDAFSRAASPEAAAPPPRPARPAAPKKGKSIGRKPKGQPAPRAAKSTKPAKASKTIGKKKPR